MPRTVRLTRDSFCGGRARQGARGRGGTGPRAGGPGRRVVRIRGKGATGSGRRAGVVRGFDVRAGRRARPRPVSAAVRPGAVSTPADEGHLGRHHRHELHVGVERQAAMCTTVRATSATSIVGSTASRAVRPGERRSSSGRSSRSPRCRCRSGRRRCRTAGRPGRSTWSGRSSRAWWRCTATECGRGACAEIEPLLMIRPPRGSWSFMARNAAWAQRKAPVRLTSTTARQSLERQLLQRRRRGRTCPRC